MNSRIILALVFLISLLSGTVSGAEKAADTPDKSEPKPWVRKVAFGILLHDIGFISDQREKGVDPNWEVQFNPPQWGWWRWVGTPSAMIGATPNFNAYTSVLYVGLAWELSLSYGFLNNLTNDFTKRMWVSGGLGPALHNGPLHKNETLCKEDNNCGFGYRVIPRIQLEVGAKFWNNHGLSLFFDHMSRKGIGSSNRQNEGIDHTGIRYHFFFNKN